MFLIEREAGNIISANRPSDDILGGLVRHWGENIRVVRLATDADYLAAKEILWPDGAKGSLELEPNGLTVIGKDAEGNVVATWTGEQVYPTP